MKRTWIATFGVLTTLFGCGPEPTDNPGSLQDRAISFVNRPVPDTLNYVRGSMAESFIHSYAESGYVDLSDPELAELFQITVFTAREGLDHLPIDAKDYMLESAAILEAIRNETLQ